MKYIDLRKEYPHLDSTYAAYPVSYKIDAMFEEYRLAEQALEKRRTRNGDVISLDSEPGIEAYAAEHIPGAEEETRNSIRLCAPFLGSKQTGSTPITLWI